MSQSRLIELCNQAKNTSQFNEISALLNNSDAKINLNDAKSDVKSDAKVDVNVQDQQTGNTPISLIIQNIIELGVDGPEKLIADNFKILDLLIQHGADIHVKNTADKSALDLAKENYKKAYDSPRLLAFLNKKLPNLKLSFIPDLQTYLQKSSCIDVAFILKNYATLIANDQEEKHVILERLNQTFAALASNQDLQEFKFELKIGFQSETELRKSIVS